MVLVNWVKNHVREVKRRVVDLSVDSMVWLISIVPNLLGFSVYTDKIRAPFFIVHVFLLSYVYAAGCIMYLVKYAAGLEDFIKCYMNISLLILIANVCWWWLNRRPLLRAVLNGVKESDRIAQNTKSLRKKHQTGLRKYQIMIICFYAVQVFLALVIYIPHRMEVHNDYAMVICVGMPVDSTPYKEVCMIALCVTEFTIMISTLNYQALLVFLIGHTAVMFNILAHEMMELNNYRDLNEHKMYVGEYLPALIRRHVLTLDVFNNLKMLYSLPIGVDFGTNFICISFFFFLPLKDWLIFMPILSYCILVFFMYCFLCQKMTDASENFESAVYCCGWENFALKEKKMVYLMFIQAQKPVVLLAADIIPVNMYTFATTLQFMYKFFTVVKT